MCARVQCGAEKKGHMCITVGGLADEERDVLVKRSDQAARLHSRSEGGAAAVEGKVEGCEDNR